MQCVLHYRLSTPDLSPGQDLYVVFLGKTLHSHSTSFHLNSIQVYNWTSAKLMLVVVVLGGEGVGREW